MSVKRGKKQALLVLGMHRSGTSATARVLNLLGVHLGTDLVEPGADNPDGFWEHAEAVRINDDLLHALGRTWYDMREMQSGWQDTEAARVALGRIDELVRREFVPHDLIGIKDPRICLTAPIWIKSLQGHGYRVECLFVVRDPREVVDSLHVRNHWRRAPLFLMWVQYIMEAEGATRYQRRALISYDQLLTDWQAAMKQVAGDFALDWPVSPSEAVAEVGGFLKQGSRHHVAQTSGESSNDMPELANKLYLACLAISRGEKSWGAISRLEKNYRAVASLYAEHVDELLKLRWQAEARATAAEAESEKQQPEVDIARLSQEIGESMATGHDLLMRKMGTMVTAMAGRADQLAGQFQALQHVLHEKSRKDEEHELASEARWQSLDNRIQALAKKALATELQSTTTLAEMNVRVERNHASLDQVKDSARRLESQTDSIRAESVAKFQELAGSLDRAVGQLQEQVQSQEATLRESLEDSNAKGRETAVAFQQATSDLQGRLEQRVEAMGAALSSRVDDFQGALAGREAKIQSLGGELARTANRLRGIETSTSWRITAPLRWIRTALMPRTWKAVLGRAIKATYDHLPLPAKRRISLKGMVFRALSPVLRNTRSYRAWKAFEAHRGSGRLHAAASHPRKATSNPAASPAVQTQSADFSVLAHVTEQHRVTDQVLGQLQDAAGKVAKDHVSMDDTAADMSRIDVRAIAFYLPQFHPIPENDEWWGRGFTEWTNVSKAVPQFVGHYQPRLPGELGFYDLRVVDVMRRQVELAKHYGLQGFCFHYYWFGGRRLLEKPLEQFLANPDIDFPFCITWANENWSRRWDGMDQDILMGQNHSPEDDIAFITALEPLLRDRRYIRVDGKPLIVLYRPSLLPDAKATQQRWREHCREVGIGEIMLAMVQFDVEDPRVFGFDVAVEFPPHKLARGLDPINDQVQIVNPEYSGYVIDYGSVIERAREHSAPDFDMIRGVFPSWDNEARKPGRGYTFANATPARYREWLDLAIDYAREHPIGGERLVFINAWNEWAEGAYLEPDRRFGYAYLQQTRDALLAEDKPSAKEHKSIVIVSHDAHPHGAQYLALHMARVFGESFGFEVHVVLLGNGSLREEFSNWATLHDLAGVDPKGVEARNVALQLSAAGVRHAIANTTVSGLFAKTLRHAGMRVISLVHELPGVIRDNNLFSHANTLAGSVDCVVFPADAVRAGFEDCIDIDIARSVIRPQGLYKLNRYATPAQRDEARQELRARLDIPAASKVILCVGYADHRKGVDLFVDIGTRLMQQRDDVHFLWVGHFDTGMEPGIRKAMRQAGLQDRFHFPGIAADTDMYYAGADVYALTSREDPFPSVVMEALQVELPVVGFAGAGGFTDLLDQGSGLVVPAGDVEAFANAVRSLLIDPARAGAMGASGRALIESNYSFHTYLFDLLDLLGCSLPKVSVVVPNYNYARYLPERIRSIVRQGVPIYELLVLDDASNDNSVDVIERLAGEIGVPLRVIRNVANSGSVFRQWAKGVELARGEFVWIAEADDLSEPTFLSSLLREMGDPQVVMAYCQSKQIDADGQLLADNYLDYTNDISTDKWLEPYRENGLHEINECLVVKNTVPNVSAVLFRRDALQAALDRDLELMCDFRIAGDWIAYLDLLEQGDLAYVPDLLNLHRRHSAGVTIGSDHRPHMLEVLRVQLLAKQRYEPSPEALRRAEDYAARLYLHFGLRDADIVCLKKQLEQTAPNQAGETEREPGPELDSQRIVPEAPTPISSGKQSE